MAKQQKTVSKTQHLSALCALSNTPNQVTPEQLTSLIHNAPDPETAVRVVLDELPTCSDVLENKWREIVIDLWSAHHPNVPLILGIPVAVSDVVDTPIVQDAITYLQIIANKPAHLNYENKEWLISAPDAYYLATQLPSRGSRLPVQLENEWQYLPMRRLRATLQALRLVRRVKDQLVIVKSRYYKFQHLPVSVQYYLLWHADTYHIDWGQFSGIWTEYIRVIQEYLPLLWSISEDAIVDMPQDIRRWIRDMWDTYHPLWEQEGLLNKQDQSALMSIVRLHSLPNALTQVILKDLYAPFGLIYGEGDRLAYTSLGLQLLEAERTQDLPCALDLLK